MATSISHNSMETSISEASYTSINMQPQKVTPRFIQHHHYRKIGGIVYLSILMPLCIGFLYVPSIGVSTAGYKEVYYTDTFQFSKLLYYLYANITGFFYVTGVTLRLRRRSLMAGRSHPYRDFLACVLLGAIMYFLGPNATLKGFDDSDHLGILILYNYCAWTIALWLGLNWTHLDIKPLRKFTMTATAMQTWNWSLWALFFLAIATLLSITGYEMYLLFEHGILYNVLIGYGSFFVTLFIIYLAVKSSHSFHFHHYQIFALIVPMTMTQNWVSAIVQGFSVGVYVEGVARWGFESFFKRRSS